MKINTNIVQKLFKAFNSKIAIGLHIHCLQDNSTKCSATVLSNLNGTIEILSQVSNKPLEQILCDLECKADKICLVITGAPVLRKIVDTNFNPQKDIFDYLPSGVKYTDFIYQTRNVGNDLELHLCRSDVISKIESIIRTHYPTSKIQSAVLGPLPCDGYINNETAEIEDGYYSIQITNKSISNYKQATSSRSGDINFYGEVIMSNYIHSYFSALRILSMNNSIKTSMQKVFDKRTEDQYYKSLSIKIIPTITILILLLSVITYSSLNQSIKTLNTNQSITLAQEIKIKKLVEESEKIKKKKGLYNMLNIGKKSSNAFYINSLMRIIPENIILSRLSLFPIHDKDIHNKNKIHFKSDEGYMEGSYTEITDLYNYMNTIIEQNLVRNLKIEYAKEDTKSNKYNFKFSFQTK
jgi:hypothetical protein